MEEQSFTHDGQLFFNEEWRSAVESVYRYKTDAVDVISNSDDQWGKVQADSDYNSFVEYAYIGDDFIDSLFIWKQIGINSTADYINNSYYAIAAYAPAGRWWFWEYWFSQIQWRSVKLSCALGRREKARS